MRTWASKVNVQRVYELNKLVVVVPDNCLFVLWIS